MHKEKTTSQSFFLNRLEGGGIVSLWSIAALYIGGLIGAGFASGQELVVFFVNHGRAGLWGVLLAILFLFLGTVLILDYCAKQNVTFYGELFARLDPRFKGLFDLLYTAFLLIGNSVMLAGVGAMGSTRLTELFFRLVTAILILAVLHKGMEGVAKTSGWLAPFLVLILCALAFQGLQRHGMHLPEFTSWRGLEAAALYGSYNLGFSMAVLASVHSRVKTTGERWKLALVSNLILGVCMVLLFFALASLSPQELLSPFPLEHVVKGWGPVALAGYRLMLWGAMYSTAIAHSLAVATRITNAHSVSWSRASLLIVAVSLIFSYFGFNTLIRIAYPILGLAGLWIIANLARQRIS